MKRKPGLGNNLKSQLKETQKEREPSSSEGERVEVGSSKQTDSTFALA